MRHIIFAFVFAAAASAAHAQDKVDKQHVEHGMKVYAAQKCSVCHSIAGKGNQKGPLDNAGRLSAEELRQWLIAPRVMAEKTKLTRKPLMPEYTKLPKEDLDALITYMRTLKKP